MYFSNKCQEEIKCSTAYCNDCWKLAVMHWKPGFIAKNAHPKTKPPVTYKLIPVERFLDFPTKIDARSI